MNYLLLLVSFFFAIIFNFFYTLSVGKDFFFNPGGFSYNFESLSGNLFIETFIFIFLWVFFFFSFSDFKKKKESVSDLWENFSFDIVAILLKNFFKKYLYYFWFLFFYISTFIIFRNYDISFSYFIFIINCIVFVLFLFTNKKLFIIRDFIKVNTVLFSTVYIGLYNFHFFWGNMGFLTIDFINSFFLLALFLISISFDIYLFKSEKIHSFFVSYFSIFLFFFLVFIFSLFFSSLSFVFSITSFFLSFLFFYIFPEINIFQKNTISLRYISLILNYTSIISSFLFLQTWRFNAYIFFILFVLWLFNFYIHKRFQNYISFFFWYISLLVAIFSFYFHFLFFGSQKYIYFLVFTFILEFLSIVLSFFISLKNIYDYIIIYIFSYLIILFWVVYFFVLNGFDIFTFWVILLLLSFSIFMTYYKINSLK